MSFHYIFSKSRELWLIFLDSNLMIRCRILTDRTHRRARWSTAKPPETYLTLPRFRHYVCHHIIHECYWINQMNSYFNHQHPLETNQFLDGFNQTLPYTQFGQPRNTRHNTPTACEISKIGLFYIKIPLSSTSLEL